MLSLVLGVCLLSGCLGQRALPHFLIAGSEERDSSEHGLGPGAKGTSCPCGWANKASSRIVQGWITQQNEFPWMASIIEKELDFNFCGGSIISSWHVLTAAHCTDDAIKEGIQLSVIVGAHNIKRAIAGITQVIDVDKIHQHEKYYAKEWKNDISLLVLKKEVTFSTFVGRACLPTQQRDYGRDYVKIIGWGNVETAGASSNLLRKVDVRVVPPAECQFMYKYLDADTPTQICTYGKRRGSCQGDSGGPVVWVDPETNKYVLVGLVSFGRACGDVSPTVHTDVAYYLPWIQAKIQASKSVPTCSKL